MTMTSSHILVLHTSCRPHDGDHAVDEVGGKNKSKTTSLDEFLESLPITCNMLLMPEIPSVISFGRNNSSDSAADTMQYSQTHLNPCGFSNVLLMENLPWKQVLLSLTSCVMVYEGSQFDIPQELPVEVAPSTSDFELVRGGTTDLFFELDVAMAMQHLEEVLEWDISVIKGPLFNSTVEKQAAEDGEFVDAAMSHSHTTHLQGGNGGNIIPGHDIDCLLSQTDIPILSTLFDKHDLLPQELHLSNADSNDVLDEHEDIPKKDKTFPLPVEPSTLDKELEALHRVQNIMERDSANLDRLIQALALIGLGLFALLLWSGYQLYATKQEDCRSKQIRKAVERKITIQSALSASRPYLVAKRSYATATARPRGVGRSIVTPLEVPSQVPQADVASLGSLRSDSSTPRVDNRSRSRISAFRSITPTRLDFSLECTSGSPTCSAVLEGDNNISKTFGIHADKTNHPRKSPSNDSLPAGISDRYIPKDSMIEESKNNSSAASAPSTSCDTESSLSPFSLLAKTWEERKAARRRNRKKTTSKLDPIFPMLESATVDSMDTITAEHHSRDSLVAPPVPVRTLGQSFEPTAAASFSKEPMQAIETTEKTSTSGRRLLVPISSHTVDENGTASSPEAKSPSMVPPPIPKLVCATPGSAESFVDDYW